MYFFYNTLLNLLTLILSPFIIIILILRKKYRYGFFQKCGFYTESQFFKKLRTRPVWIHAVSVGEVMSTTPLVNIIRKNFPDLPIILSTVTKTGNFTAHHNVKGVDLVIYFPYDYNFIVKKVISKISPLIFVTLETELWPNFSRELHLQNIPSIVVSGRISSESFKRYSFFSFFFKRVLSNIDFFCMQSKTDADRIISIGASSEKVALTGNIKFDLKIPGITTEEIKELQKDLHLNDSLKILIAGSTHRGEEEIIIKVFTRLKKKINTLLLILAPRHPERFNEVEDLLKNSKLPYLRRTALPIAPQKNMHHVILLDTIGELSKSYSIADIVFIGGSLVPVGGHNVLEAAVFSKPVLYGKYMDNFREVASLLEGKKGAIQVNNEDEFFEQSLLLLNNKELCRQIGETAFQVINENSGSVNKSMIILKKILENSISKN